MATTSQIQPNFRIDRLSDGTIAAATGESEGRYVDLRLERQPYDQGTGAQLLLLLEGHQLLSSECTLSTQSEQVSYEVRAGEFRMRFAADFSRYDENHLVFVEGDVAGVREPLPFEGVYDLRSRRGTFDASLDSLLPVAVKTDLRPFASLLYELYFRQLNDSLQYQQDVDLVVQNSKWRAAGRAACWGLGAGAASVAGVVTGPIPPLAPVVAAVVFGAAASVCSELFKDPNTTVPA